MAVESDSKAKTNQKPKAQEQDKAAENRAFFIKQLYVKSLDFDVNTPLHVLQKEWKPDAKLDLDVSHTPYADGNYGIELKIMINVTIENKQIFNIKMTHGGLFQMSGYNGEEMARLVNSFCPNIIFPYARQVVSQITTQAGFPPLNLAPVDFEARFQMMLQQAKEKNKD